MYSKEIELNNYNYKLLKVKSLLEEVLLHRQNYINNKQELLATKLIFSQIIFAINMQKKGGTFILKVFDLFLESSVDLLYILSCFYDSVIVTKPNTLSPGSGSQHDAIVYSILLKSSPISKVSFLPSIFEKTS